MDGLIKYQTLNEAGVRNENIAKCSVHGTDGRGRRNNRPGWDNTDGFHSHYRSIPDCITYNNGKGKIKSPACGLSTGDKKRSSAL